MSEAAENPFDRPALAVVVDPFAAERAEREQQTRDALEWLRGPVARRLAQHEAEARLREVLPLAVVPFDEWQRFAQRRQPDPLDGELTVTCPCPCGHSFGVGLRGDVL